MSRQPHHPWLHRLAVSTVGVAMITLVAGALVTSRHAGMAFRDWPTSDGHNMLTYPWLADFARDGDKFLEHGHRLAGMLIGAWSILLVVATFRSTSNRAIRALATGVLLGVICQGILGGFRVQLDERGLAMLHGVAASLVFSLMGCMVVVTSGRWQTSSDLKQRCNTRSLVPLALSLVAVLLLQYLLGGMIRHRGTGLHEHLGMGLLVPVLALVNYGATRRSGVDWLKRSALVLLLVVVAQSLLGGATWIVKFGFTPTGYVATADSIGQVALRTSHMVWGAVVMMSAVAHALKVCRVAVVCGREGEWSLATPQLSSGGAP